MIKTSHNKKPAPDEGVGASETSPRMSEDSQAFIGLKLRELYDDVVAEPVPDRILELLQKLGGEEKKPE